MHYFLHVHTNLLLPQNKKITVFSFFKRRGNKDFLRDTKPQRTHHQHTYNTRNVTPYPSGKSKMTTDRNIDRVKEIKSNRNGNYMSNKKIFFLIVHNP